MRFRHSQFLACERSAGLRKNPAAGRDAWPAIAGRILVGVLVSIPLGLLIPEKAYSGPSSAEFQPLTATVTVLDENGVPMPRMSVATVNHEYGFRQSATTDARGQAALTVMPGTWAFYATPIHESLVSHPGRGYLLVRQREVFDGASRSITLAPDLMVKVNLVSSVFDFTKRENHVGFVAEPYGKFLPARVACITPNNVLTLQTNRGLTVAAFVVSPGSTGPLLYFVQTPRALSSPFVIEVTASNSGLLQVNARNAKNVPTDYHIQLHTSDLSWEWSPYVADVAASVTQVRVSCNDFYMVRAVDARDDASERWRLDLHPIVLHPKPGQSLSLSLGGPLAMGPVRTTPRAAPGFAPACQVMPFFQDANGNIVLTVNKFPGGEVKPQIVVQHGSTAAAPSQVAGCLGARFLEQFDRAENPSCRISWDFGPWGSGTVRGDLYGQEERRMAIDETALLLSQAPRIDRDHRLAKVLAYQELADVMQRLPGVPADYRIGVISNICIAGFEDEVQHGYKLENAMEIGRATGWRPAGDGYTDHEAGHGRIQMPPCRFHAVPPYAVEAYATLVGCRARAELFGGPEYLKYLLGGHDLFLRYRPGTPPSAAPDLTETMQFITHYINERYGWTPHRRMILEWNNAFRGLRAALDVAKYSEIEQFAVLHSWLCGDNLGSLFEAAHFRVTSDKVDGGLATLRSFLDSQREVHVGVGINEVVAPRTSIPVELVGCSSSGVSDVRTTVRYDASKARVEAVRTRDLTDSATWYLEADTGAPGVIRLHLFGSKPIVNPGSIAQINLALLPGAFGAVAFSLSETSADGKAAASTNGTVFLPDAPLIGPFPTLPDATLARPYSASLWAVAGTPPYAWSIVEDALPPGLMLEASTGEIQGQCSQKGEYLFRVAVADRKGAVAHRWFTIPVMSSSGE